MNYARHNFTHNFLNAVAVDTMAAWDILVNEINEIVLDYPKDVEKAIRDSSMRIHNNPSPKDMVDVIHDGIYENKELQKRITKLIAKRHTDPHYAADGGSFDKIIVDGQARYKTNNASEDILNEGAGLLNADGDLLNDESGMLNAVGPGLGKMIQRTKEKVGAKMATKRMAQDNLAAKEKQRGLTPSTNKGQFTMGKILLIVGAVAAVGTLAYFIYQANKSKPATA
jgi:hypothetical protein